MRIIAKAALRDFWAKHADAEQPIKAWHALTKAADWENPVQVKSQFGTADILPDNRIVFNIGGNKYRLIVKVSYKWKIVYIRFIGTHSEYDAVDATTI
jgi:mRNA interferase HigB